MVLSVTGLADPSGGAGSTRLSFREAMKEQWLPAQEDFLFSKDTAILGVIGSKDSTPLVGRQAVTVAMTNRPQGLGARGELDRLPTPTGSSFVNGYLRPKKMNGRLQLTPELEMDARGGESSWVEAMTNELEAISEQMEMEISDQATWGRANIKGRFQGAPTAGGVATLYGRNNRGATAARFFDRGLSTADLGPANMPFFRNMRISMVPSSAGANGQPHDHTNDGFSSGDIGDNTLANEVYLDIASGTSVMDGSVTASPTISLFRNSAAVDLSAVTEISGGFITPYGQRQVTPSYADAALSIDQFKSTEGLASYLAGSSVYAAIYGQLKSASVGFQAGYFTDAVPGTDRQVTERLVEHAVRRSGMKTGGNAPSYVGLMTWAQWGELAKEHENLKRFEPVLGNGGTNMVGNTPEGYRYIGGGGGAVYKPSWAAIHKSIYLVTPESWSYMENQPLHMLEPDGRIVPDYDVTQYVWLRRGNFKCNRIMKEAVVDDLAEDEFAIT